MATLVWTSLVRASHGEESRLVRPGAGLPLSSIGRRICLTWLWWRAYCPIRYLVSHPRVVLTYPRGSTDGPLRIWTDSDLVGDVATRKSCSVGYIQRDVERIATGATAAKYGVVLRGA